MPNPIPEAEISGQDPREEANQAYLAAGVRWIRLLLWRAIGETEKNLDRPSDAAQDGAPGGRGGGPRETRGVPLSPKGRGFFRRGGSKATPVTHGEPVPSSGAAGEPIPTESDLRQARLEVEKAAAADPTPALPALAARIGLSPFEEEILLLCAAMELDTGIAQLCARAQGDPGSPCPTFALAMGLFREPAWEALSPERPLRYWHLVEVDSRGMESIIRRPIRLDPRILGHLTGMDHLDERLALHLAPEEGGTANPSGAPQPLAPSQERSVAAIREAVLDGADGGAIPVLQLVGPHPESTAAVALRAAVELGLHLHRLPRVSIPRSREEAELLVRLWGREALLRPVALLMEGPDTDSASDVDRDGDKGDRSLAPLFSRTPGVLFVSTRVPLPLPGRRSQVVEVDRPTPEEQQDAWRTGLGDGEKALAARLAGQFHLDLATLRAIAEEGPEGAWDACLLHTAPRMDRLAHRMHPAAGWEDLVLPEEARSLLRQLSAQVAGRTVVYDQWGFRTRLNRGLGISALFAGESGTGKTMAAEVMARELRLHLYRIDLSAVVSKYIGETEKNLSHLFDAAEDGGAILFFDEADALFGKRTEVKDSHDRYANIEVNYLLQRMEAYRGLAILATNKPGALDPAFLRRLRMIVRFPFPDTAQRRAIWERAWPRETPLGPLDLDRLARFPLTGGSISNVALASAFQAAAGGSRVTMPLVLEAVGTELRKLERPVRDEDLRWEAPPMERPGARSQGSEGTRWAPDTSPPVGPPEAPTGAIL
jgi:hypothetical protein